MRFFHLLAQVCLLCVCGASIVPGQGGSAITSGTTQETPETGAEASPDMPPPAAIGEFSGSNGADESLMSQGGSPAAPPPVAVKPPPPLPDQATADLPPQPVGATQPTQTDYPLGQPFSAADFGDIQPVLFGEQQITDFTQHAIALGDWHIKPHLSVSNVYDGNVFIKSSGQSSDFITELDAGFAVRLGEPDGPLCLTADYTVGPEIYWIHGDEDSINQKLSFDLKTSFTKLTLGLKIAFTDDTGNNIDATDLVHQRLVSTTVTSHYVLGGKTSVDLNVDYSYDNYVSLISSQEERVEGFFNYQAWPKLNLGVGGAVGLLTAQGGGDQKYEEASLRGLYAATGKLTIIASAGVQDREFQAGGSVVNPVFGIQFNWEARQGTTLSIDAERALFASAITQDQDYAATGTTFTVTQRLGDNFTLQLSCGYENLDYQAAGTGITATRNDNFFFIRPGIQWVVTSWCTLGLYYEFSENISHGEGAHSFSQDRLGVQTNILF